MSPTAYRLLISQRPTLPAWRLAGLISWDLEGGDGTFIRGHPARRHRWIPVEGLYAGALFGVLAIDIFTTTGMRMNEALQIRIEPDCFLELTTPTPAGAQDQTPRTAWVFRLIPKGERDQRPQNYRVGDQVRHQIAKTVWYLAMEHYCLGANEPLPTVAYARGVREHRFPPGRYLVQHRRRALTNVDLNACIRFLVHQLRTEARNLPSTAGSAVNGSNPVIRFGQGWIEARYVRDPETGRTNGPYLY